MKVKTLADRFKGVPPPAHAPKSKQIFKCIRCSDFVRLVARCQFCDRCPKCCCMTEAPKDVPTDE